ncbi:14887_t:CDS:2 [Cetraspora pellucida]|uniref:14887_t:CDS:1 n=1 Tax=Cetraspora pellucida TaxID=1433469 RepID=A0A9N9DL17_9GLOM|nr:14887_t:CDS:2 [Cetraspora pellucida]
MKGSIFYENEVFGYEFAFVTSNIIKTEIWKEIIKTIFFKIIINENTDIFINKYLVIYIIYSNSLDIIDKLVVFALNNTSIMIENKNNVV